MNTFCKGCQNLTHIFLFWLEELDQCTIVRQQNEIMPPYYSTNQSHVHQFVSVLLALAAHDIEELLGKSLRVVNEVNRHIIDSSGFNFFFSESSRSLFLFLIQSVLFGLSLPDNTLFGFELSRINGFIITVWKLLKRHSCFHEEMTGHQSDSARGCKTSLSNDVDRPGISPDIPFVELYHHFQRLL